jgi:hypothetical protein
MRSGLMRGMLGQHVERPVGVAHHGERVELVLVGDRAGDAPAGERVEDEGRDPDRVQLAGPQVERAADSP